ncbi:MAG TPA: tRNA (guanosine(37)-N1)-methyltransferase TrmD [Chitinophagales bacterium]|nr:tRNA (guanosine(37)-N1)-methyltransferase TrmD [Chitinophagales bacterium]HMW12953.1 tRNA (guanosine(37)-N1)-methyltransferase TrmD [Chitinophagales bacterium]HMX59504.1 tRNA (guanosine(37)-N1)-methyltransferase TrmD [Chitinophagales bacterium]HMY22842.1 tRNA (guanosine(37)-N1)-methyltransferase TrmD [Chitinophagales bacterium]HMZ32764.1 tRNA (guanosine(37)-N1)-methyltransferase TrmD [Chitinophagales bacterium]
MRIDILSAVPDLMQSFFAHSILQRAKERNLLEIHLHNIHDYSKKKYKQIDDYQFGGGAGMVMSIEPILTCIEKLQAERKYDDIIFMTPDGELLEQKMVNSLSLKQNIIILAGHYKGIDERLREHVITKEISIGSYVLSGGELPAAVLVDAIGRLIPGVLNDETSALTDSFQDNLLAPPVYTRPSDYKGWKVPEILLSGNDKLIAEWRHQQALERTQQRRPDLLEND